MNQTVETMKPQVLGGGAETAGSLIAGGATIQQIQTPYATAVSVQKPRDLNEVQKRCIQEAALAGEICFYGWGSGENRVEGPSIELAMIAARNWGNCVVNTKDPLETPHSYIIATDFIDLETGYTYCRPFRQSKRWTVHGKMDEIRKEDVRFQIGVSKSQRNSVLRALPGWLIDKMMDQAKAGVREKIEEYIKKNSIEGARKKAMDTLARYGVKLDRIEAKYEKKYAAWDVETLVILAGDIKALETKMESADVLFPDPSVKVDPETGEITDPGKPTGLATTTKMENGDPKSYKGYPGAKPAGESGDKSSDGKLF